MAENSTTAGAKTITILVEEDLQNDRLRTVVQDDGRGMEDELLAVITDPFVTSRTTRKVGLGIPLFKAAAEACNGSLGIDSELGRGTRVEVDFQRSHIDRMPLGDLAGTMLTLVVGYPKIHWVFHYRANGTEFMFDDEPIKKELEGIPLTEPLVLTYLKELLQEGVANVERAITERQAARELSGC
jgi:hypothetical protein